MPTGRESKWGTSLPPVSISCQVCSPDIDYVQGSTLRKIEYHRVNITLSYECNSRGIHHYSKYSKAENCCSLERRSAEVVPIIEVRVWDWAFRMIKTKKCLVSLEKPTQISYLLSLALLLKIDRKGWRELLSEILSFLKLRKATPPEQSPTPLFPPLMKDPRLASYSFVGRNPRAFFSQEAISRINQPTNP